MTSAHKISERTPIAASRVKPSADGLGDRLRGVERARPEVAINDAERGECCRGRRSLSGAGRYGTSSALATTDIGFRPPRRRPPTLITGLPAAEVSPPRRAA